MITRPILPPRAGYVERVNADGVHYYEPTAETLARRARDAENAGLKQQNALIETAICQIDEEYNERVTSAEDAICELDMLINGGTMV